MELFYENSSRLLGANCFRKKPLIVDGRLGSVVVLVNFEELIKGSKTIASTENSPNPNQNLNLNPNTKLWREQLSEHLGKILHYTKTFLIKKLFFNVFS